VSKLEHPKRPVGARARGTSGPCVQDGRSAPAAGGARPGNTSGDVRVAPGAAGERGPGPQLPEIVTNLLEERGALLAEGPAVT